MYFYNEEKRRAFLKCALWSRCIGLEVVSAAGIKACDEILEGEDYRIAVAKMKETVYKHYRKKSDDVVSVVRCRDCIHFSPYPDFCTLLYSDDVDEDFYCRYGERYE